MRIYLIRHAEAEGNSYRRAHGHYDSLLTPNGHSQLEKLTERLGRLPIDAVYASDLYRARQTAKAVADSGGLAVYIDPLLREINLGKWEDKPWGQIRHEDPKRLTLFTQGHAVSLPGGEVTREAHLRMRCALTRIAKNHPDSNLVVVSHGVVIKMFLQRIAGRPIAHLDNASVSQVEFMSGSFRVLDVGQNEFLGEYSTLARQSWWRESGSHEIEFRFVPVRVRSGMPRVCRLGQTAWESVYDTREGFDAENFGIKCEHALQQNPRYVQFIMEKDKVVGLLQMHDENNHGSDDLHIGLVYMEPPLRGRGLGAQTMGEAVSVARRAGKQFITLRVWHKNIRGLAFYHKMGFVEFDREEGSFGPLVLMRKAIFVPPLTQSIL